MAQLLTRNDILSQAEYESIRERFRREIMVKKGPRRVLVGSNCSVHFENREIMRYQIMEMLRCEGTFDNDEAVEDELHSYNPLITQPGKLSVTVMFEYPTEEERQTHLTNLVGIHEHIWFQVGDGQKVLGEFDAAQIDLHKVSSVQFVKFSLPADQQHQISAAGTVLRLIIDHPKYQAQAVLGEETRRAIAEDMG